MQVWIKKKVNQKITAVETHALGIEQTLLDMYIVQDHRTPPPPSYKEKGDEE